jgi:hypothetical protein
MKAAFLKVIVLNVRHLISKFQLDDNSIGVEMNCREYFGHPTYGHDNCPCCPVCGIDLMCESRDGSCLCTQAQEDEQRKQYEYAMYEQYCKDAIAEMIVNSFTTA